MDASELELYLARIAYTGPRAPRAEVLHALTAAHTQHIPFENLDVLLGERIDLSEGALFDKLVVRQRGGYCFEQNGLFHEVLLAFGFEVTPLSARSRYDVPRGTVMPRTHVFLRVEAEGESWITDVGFGNMSLTAALRFELDVPQSTPHERRRLVRDGEVFVLQAQLGSNWHDVCEFTGEAMYEIDREVANWYTSAHPKSHFRNRLIVARAAEGGRRITLLNDRLKLRDASGEAREHAIAGPEHVLAVLREHFGLHFPAGTRFELAA